MEVSVSLLLNQGTATHLFQLLYFIQSNSINRDNEP